MEIDDVRFASARARISSVVVVLVGTVALALPPGAAAGTRRSRRTDQARADSPAIVGTAIAGQLLSETHAGWAGRPIRFTYQWQDCNAAGTGCSVIPGATRRLYQLGSRDVGHRIRVVERANGANGPAVSSPTAVVTHSSLARAARSGSVQATVTFEPSASGTPTLFYSRPRLEIARHSQVVYDEPLSSRYCMPITSCSPSGGPHSTVRVRALEAGAGPDVVLGLYTGGAHCCSVEQVFSYRSLTNTYAQSEHDFGNPGAGLRRLGAGGRYEFVSADNRFAYAFTDFAASGMPLQVFAFANGRFVDVTASHRRLLSGDARYWWRSFVHNLRDGLGFIAAWAADEELLGKAAVVNHRLRFELQHGNLRSPLPEAPAPQHFVVRLQRLLDRWGYLRGRG